ncbi:hypothetical protein AMAG_08629 [Allomyces macrogynus ATCC 38327]|uniref:Uncharacterized protein n=1 Tax=Allomyces macrogynus (strain ATCC 38327) TaxID=578462 RepID=A0A0L0SLX8_ALLM3|nr:hypothetical protein AMAG_08629 [Allomyces macrogynus ATCC 38327]|eukprot:KNE63507.1 hypothetical protein AMAG_08629 [Allomyces macrogynus ATCC 38327]
MAPATTPQESTSLLLQAALARRKKLAELKTQILGDPIKYPVPKTEDGNEDNGDDSMDVDENEDQSNEGDIAREERVRVEAYQQLATVTTVEELAAALLHRAAAEAEAARGRAGKVADASELAPKKANADLKRDLERRTARLERKTMAAIDELIRRRVLGSAGAGAPTPNQSGTLVVDLADAVDSLYARVRQGYASVVRGDDSGDDEDHDGPARPPRGAGTSAWEDE